ncbi:MAG: hypothetical protein ACI85O_000033 [Saprospiraceae bacterium]|jgi:hypothetical protein
MNKRYYLLFCGVFLFFSCQSDKKKNLTKDEVVVIKIEEKVNRWKNSMQQKCTENILDAAAALVDSTLIARARLDVDSIPKPLKPIKPDMPVIKELKDTLPIAPILDSLRR